MSSITHRRARPLYGPEATYIRLVNEGCNSEEAAFQADCEVAEEIVIRRKRKAGQRHPVATWEEIQRVLAER